MFMCVFILSGCWCGDEAVNVEQSRVIKIQNLSTTLHARTENPCYSRGNHFIGTAFRDNIYRVFLDLPGRIETKVEEYKKLDHLPDSDELKIALQSPRKIIFSQNSDRMAFHNPDKNPGWYIFFLLPGGGPGFVEKSRENEKSLASVSWDKIPTSRFLAGDFLGNPRKGDTLYNQSFWKALIYAQGDEELDLQLLEVLNENVQNFKYIQENFTVRAAPESRVSNEWRQRLDEYLQKNIDVNNFVDADDIEICLAAREYCSRHALAIDRLMEKYDPEYGHYPLVLAKKYLNPSQKEALLDRYPDDKVIADFFKN